MGGLLGIPHYSKLEFILLALTSAGLFLAWARDPALGLVTVLGLLTGSLYMLVCTALYCTALYCTVLYSPPPAGLPPVRVLRPPELNGVRSARPRHPRHAAVARCQVGCMLLDIGTMYN